MLDAIVTVVLIILIFSLFTPGTREMVSPTISLPLIAAILVTYALREYIRG